MTPRQRVVRRTALIAALVVVGIAAVVVLRPTLSPEPEPDAGIVDVLARNAPADAPRMTFVERSGELLDRPFVHFAGTRSHRLPEDMGSGVAWGDCDGDGRLDLFAAAFGGPLGSAPEERSRDALYRNTGEGFVDVAEEAGIGSTGHSLGAAWGDYDADGDADLYVTRYGSDRLYRNEGGCRFEDVTERAGIETGEAFGAGVTWGDYDGDGDLDVYVTNYVRFDAADDPGTVTMQYGRNIPFTLNPSSYPAEPNFLFRNEGDGTFTEVARAAGVDNPQGRSLSAVWADFDLDTDLDLYVANDISDNAFYRNRGDGTFEDVSSLTLTADYRGAMGLAVADLDGDRDLDFFVSHWLAQENALYLNMTSEVGGEEIFFRDDAERFGLGYTGLEFVGWGAGLLDFDNDGRRDLLVVNGNTLEDEREPVRLVPQRPQLFWNRGAEGFYDVTELAGADLTVPRVARGAAVADWDADGDVDFAVIENGGGLLMFENVGPPRGSWLTVDLRQEGPNLRGIGSLVTVESAVGSQTLAAGAAPSYLSQEPYLLHFGLGQDPGSVNVRVRWPDGKEELWRLSSSDRRVLLERGDGAPPS